MPNDFTGTPDGHARRRGVATPNVSGTGQRFHESLLGLEQIGGLAGWIARGLLAVGNWIIREHKERTEMIGGIDNMWLLLSDVTEFNPVCASTYTFKTKLSLEGLEKAAVRLADKFPRYKERLASMRRKLHGPHFEPDPDFDVNNHVRIAPLPHPAGKRELDDLMGNFIAQEWNFTRPLWEMLLVENYQDEDGAHCALVTRAHHTLADGQGQSFMNLAAMTFFDLMHTHLLSSPGFVLSQMYLTSYYDEVVETMDSSARKLAAAKRGQLRPSQFNRSLQFLDPLAENRFTALLVQVIIAFLFWVALALSTAASLFWSTYQGFHQATLFLLTCWRVEMVTRNYHGSRVKEREYSSSKSFAMDDVKLCQRAFSGPPPDGALRKLFKRGYLRTGHVTLNDVVCSVMADVLGEEIAKKRVTPGLWNRTKQSLKHVLPSPIGFFIPISVREPGDWSMRNLSTGSIVYLNPSQALIGTVLPHELHSHIHACRSELSLLKHSIWPKLSFELIQLTGQAPITWPVPFALLPQVLFSPVRNVIRDCITVPILRFSLQSFPVILTNVPGPPKPLTLAGVEVLNWTALPPQAGKGTIGLGIISYAGGICISVATDKVPGSEGAAYRLCQRFERRFKLYVAKAKQILDSEAELEQ